MTGQTLDTNAGQAVYSPVTLTLYDIWVLGVTNQWIWQCSTPKIGKMFTQHTGERHADIGVGTGYLLKHYLPSTNKHLSLIDLNPSSLAYAAKQARKFSPMCYQRDIYQPIDLPEEPFDSISINYLLHCLPGSMKDKTRVFENISGIIREGGTLFGSTVLGRGIKKNIAAKRLMALYNSKGIFSNSQDNLEDLKVGLEQHFQQVTIEVKGCVALFKAIK